MSRNGPSVTSATALARFLLENLEAILAEWERFAGTLPAAAGMDRAGLRDDAEALLRGIAADMQTAQTEEERQVKSEGRKPRGALGLTAAESHAGVRLDEGFDLKQMVSEYRALRASVLRLWMRRADLAERDDLEQMTRFHEAIDEALTESIAHYKARLDRARELFVGIIGHDVRTPLGVILNSAGLLARAPGLDEAGRHDAERIVRNARRIDELMSDLLDATRARLGQPMPLCRAPMDLADACRQAAEDAESSHPGRKVIVALSGGLAGPWDFARISQLLANLLSNALRHGGDAPIALSAQGDDGEVMISVHNEGAPIPAASHRRIFEPLVQEGPPAEGGSGLGLGLYIARAIAEAHGGSIEVQSSAERGTTFTVRLPR